MSELINIINHVFDDFGLPPALYGTKRFLSDEICELILESGIHYNISLNKNDGVIDETSISSTRNETPRELFDKFFDREKVKMKK